MCEKDITLILNLANNRDDVNLWAYSGQKFPSNHALLIESLLVPA